MAGRPDLASQKTRRTHDIIKRVNVIAEIRAGASIVATSKKYAVCKSSIEDWMKEEDVERGDRYLDFARKRGEALISELASEGVDIPYTAKRIKAMLEAKKPDPCGPGQIDDSRAVLTALDMLIKILGAYAPSKHEVSETGQPKETMFDLEGATPEELITIREILSNIERRRNAVMIEAKIE